MTKQHSERSALDFRNLKTVRQLAEESPFSEAAIRWWLFCAQDNGFSRCVVRRGRRVYIDAEALNRWLEEGREK